MARAVKYDIVIEQRATFTQTYTYTDSGSTPIDLTNSSARSQIRRQGVGTLIYEMTSGNGGIILGGTAGTVTLLIPAANTATIPAGNFLYNVEIVSGSVVTRLVEGKCAVHAGVTVTADLLPDTVAPSVPTDLVLTVLSTTQIDLDWTTSVDPVVAGQARSGLAGYRIYQDGVLIDTIALITAYSATGLTENTAYFFQVSAYDIAGNASDPCTAVSATTDPVNVPDTPDVTPPTVPTGLTLTVKGTTQIDLSWDPSTDPTVPGEIRSGMAAYRIYRNGTLLVATGATTYSAVGLTPNTLYSFTVSALDVATNESAQCAPVTATTDSVIISKPDVTPPSVPTSLHPAAVVSTTQIDLSWTASTDPLVPPDTQSGLAGYKVYKDGVLLATLGAVTSYSAVGLSPGTSYSFTVSAFDAAGNESAQSSPAVAATNSSPDTTAPTVPTNLALGVISAIQIDMTWSASTDPTVAGALHSGLSGYKVYKNGVLLATLGNVLTYSATGLTAATLYTFRVSAFDVAGNESAQSTAQSATTGSNPDTTAPSVPAGLTATAVSTSGINLSWTASTDPTVTGQARSGLSGYKVYKDGSLLATLGLVTTYSATGLTASTLYSFRVSAFDAATNESAQSTAATATTLAVTAPDTTAPTVPTNLALAVVSATQITLSWTASTDPIVSGQTTSGVSGYKVYKDGVLLATLGLVVTYNATGLTAGTTYSFRVSAIDAATNESAQSTAASATTSNNPDITAPTVPTGLSAVVVSATRIDLAWTASTDPTVVGQVKSGLSGYKVYRNGTLLITLGLVTTYSATNLTAGTLYSFRVSAIDVAGNESAQSTAATGTTTGPDITAPSVPAGLAPTVISSTQINLTWSASTDPTVGGAVTSGVAGYRVYRGGTLIGSPTATSFSATGLAPSTLYSFTVAAIDVAGNLSAQSAAQTATTSAAPVNPDITAPSVPTGLALTVVGSSQINLAWSASTDPAVAGAVTSGMAGYKIYRNGTLLTTLGVVTSYSATGLTASTNYSFRVSAIDVAGNESAQGTAVAATTDTAPAPGTALADWNYRSTLPGTLWAHRFTTPNDPALWFGMSPQDKDTNKRAGYIGPLPPSSTNLAETGKGYKTTDGIVRADAGIIGDGCLELYVPAYVDTGGLSFRRPLMPTTGAMTVSGNGIVPWVPTSTAAVDLDVNLAGLPRYNPQKHASTYPGDIRAKLGGMVGGMITHPSDVAQYQRAIPATTFNDAANEISYSGADGIYIQYRTKFKTLPTGKNRLDFAETTSYTSNAVTAATNIGSVNKSGTKVYSLTPGATTLTNVGTNHELQAPVTIGGTVYSQFITLTNCGAFNGTWRILSIDPSSANKVYLELNSTGFAVYDGTGTWSTIFNRYELTVGAGHDFWTPISDAGLIYRQRLDVTGGTFAGSYYSDGITTTGVIVRIGWTMPAFTGPATVTGFYGPSEGKLWNIYTQPSNSGGLSHQVVNTTRPDPGSAGQNTFFLFGNAGAWLFAGALEQTSNSLIQNQNPSCTYTSNATCWKYPKDEWVTFLIHLIPGQQNLGRQVVPDLAANASLAITAITKSGTATVIKVPGLAAATKFHSLPYMQIVGTSNWSDPTRTLKPTVIDTVAETLSFPWNTTTMPAYNSGGILRMGALQGWDSWRTTTATKFNMGLEVWVARAGATSYTLLHSVLNYQMYYDTDYGVSSIASRYPPEIAYTVAAPGYNYIEFYSYMNPNTGASVPYAFPLWVLYDQLICSTQFIPCPGATVTPPPTLPPYSTAFGTAENPLFENGAWLNSSTRYTKVKTVGGRAFGQQTGAAGGTLGNAFDDSYAYLSGTWTANQEISGVIYKSGSSGIREVELLLRWAEPGGLPRGYECLLAHDGSYVQLVKWMGTLDGNGDTSFQYLHRATPTKVPANGDAYRAVILGNTVSVYLAGVLQFSHDVSKAEDETTTIPVWTTGSPGVGFYTNTAADLTYGFESISAQNSVASGGINAVSASQADVAAAIAAAPVGGTVNIPAAAAGTVTWSTLSINKAVTLVGAGVGVTNITLGTGNSITKQTTNPIWIRGFTFSSTSAGAGNHAFAIGGSWTARPIIIEDCRFNNTTSNMFRIGVAGGCIFAKCSFYALWDDSNLQIKAVGDTQSWITNHSMGTADTTGEKNHYIEDCYFHGAANQNVDADDAARVVFRYNRCDYASFNSHGLDTSAIGLRHFEIYNNKFWNMSAGGWTGGSTNSDLSNQNWAIWIRGGTGVIYNNDIDNIANNNWGFSKSQAKFDIRSQQDNSGAAYGYFQDGRAKYSGGQGTYPRQNQLAMNWSTSLTNTVGINGGVGDYFIDPIYCWNNSGAGCTGGVINDFANGGSWGSQTGYFISGRDFFNTASTARPSYTAYTYPHPLRVTTGQAY